MTIRLTPTETDILLRCLHCALIGEIDGGPLADAEDTAFELTRKTRRRIAIAERLKDRLQE